MLGGILVLAASTILFAFAHNYYLLLLARGLQGMKRGNSMYAH
jgi:predicted MFS family arabinose efflux permease